MSQSAQPYRDPEASPTGHAGTRVQIQERQAWSISGWFGVLVVAACIAAVYEPPSTSCSSTHTQSSPSRPASWRL